VKKMSFDDLSGKVCVITGGAGVIGSSLAKALASVGTKVAILDRDESLAQKKAEEIAKEFNCETLGVKGDVLQKSSLVEAKKLINDKLGKIDLLINGAGGNHPDATTKVEIMEKGKDVSLEDTFYGLQIDAFQKVFDLNFLGTLLPTMVFTTDMHGSTGSVLNVSSMNSFKPLTKIPAYSAAKSAINNFTEWLAVHLAKMDIRVNALAPGFFLTNQNRFLLTDEKSGDLTPRGEKIISNTPMGRFGDVDELQGTVLYLLSDVSKFITGIVIPVDGGYSAFGGV
jgi:NAD(P)-dependent dehydrogenase (short-subunit alcohol dehydrogenase family)